MFQSIRNTHLAFTSGLLFFTIVLFSCSSDENNLDPDIDSSIEVNLDINAIMKMINDERANGTDCGSKENSPVEKLLWSDDLAEAALAHSNDMQINDYFSHTSEDGRKFQDRVRETNFSGTAIGENIAIGYSTESAVIQGWMESDGHCNNIMKSNANVIGVARSDEGAYWTMILGSE
ncbi:Cysteine-rich secretory protein family protein [Marivirga sericea]|uniref:Cysteine-rich secretory protein family protein n=1 Tax=Marivirga sericea TaxID=1028 RepID=A0A1X7LDX5_9BACT|nr:CAP domain-containing protein [Marivirga sericea]SMG51900.1 Cysteine-rich secretory protein family protein [Marivirga sericea]